MKPWETEAIVSGELEAGGGTFLFRPVIHEIAVAGLSVILGIG